jgi:hypothetical protein
MQQVQPGHMTVRKNRVVVFMHPWAGYFIPGPIQLRPYEPSLPRPVQANTGKRQLKTENFMNSVEVAKMMIILICSRDNIGPVLSGIVTMKTSSPESPDFHCNESIRVRLE